MADKRRIYSLILFMGAAGGLFAALTWGRSVGMGFAAGSLLAAINYWCLESLVQRVGRVEDGKIVGAPPGVLALRYLLLGLSGYAIVRFSGANVLALLVGCLTALAALVLETLYQLLYGRT